MITEEEYYKIRLILSGRPCNVKKISRNPNFPLRRTVKCGVCGRPLTGSCSRGRGGKYFYYHCYNKQCSTYGKGVSKAQLESDFVEYLNLITPKKEFLDSFSSSVLSLWKEKDTLLKEENRKYQKQLETLQEKRKRIFEMREDGSYSLEEFRERKEETDNAIMAIKISLNETRIDQFDIQSVLSYANNFICNLGRQWLDLANSHLRFQKMVFPDGIPYVRGKGFRTCRLGLIYEFNQTCRLDKSLLVHRVIIGWNQIMEELMEWEKLKNIGTADLEYEKSII